eukprot:gb/GFBE01001667.1/.p1 GENE.gb/GFBE01001667.1/~~gb/GFBE01001667.1/.p1  ORF type:complete len:1504 (+),score=424.68 gb/GFBE01001667.1/:1-4512(+)
MLRAILTHLLLLCSSHVVVVSAMREVSVIDSNLTAVRPGDTKTQELLAELDALVGLTKVKKQMRQLIEQVKFNIERKHLKLLDIGSQSLHMSFNGNPGTGKTVVARIVGELLVSMGAIKPAAESRHGKKKDIVTEASRADLVAEYVGQTAPKVKKMVQQAMGGVLFIDEAYALIQGDRDTFGQEAVDTLIKEMEDKRGDLIVIFAGYETEMAAFMAANPGFKSRVAFEFSFPDYTCPELVKIGELNLKGKNMQLSTGGEEFACSDGGSRDAAESCAWLKASIRLQTGCCETADCDQEENRANGNGRTVRNVLEASYRSMASRVLTTYPPSVLEAFDKDKKPRVEGKDKKAQPKPALDCGFTFERIRKAGPFTQLEDLKGADVRCAFRLLEAEDLKGSLADSLTEQITANCMRGASPQPVNVNVTLALEKPGAVSKLDWDKLHEQLTRERLCQEPQALLGARAAPSLIQMSSEEESNQENTVLKCDQYYCTDSRGCKNTLKCGGCWASRRSNFCKRYMPDPSGKSVKPHGATPPRTPTRPSNYGASPYGRPEDKKCHEFCERSLLRSPSACSNYETLCGGCEMCLRGKDAYPVVPPKYGGYKPTPGGYTPGYGGYKPGHGGYTPGKPVYGGGGHSPYGGGGHSPYGGGGHSPYGGGGKTPEFDPYGSFSTGYKPIERPGSQVQKLMDELNELIGLEEVKAGMSGLRDSVEFDLWRRRFLGEAWSLLGQSFHMKFLGNPGTGKTVVARIIGKILVELKVVKQESKNNDFIFKEVSRSDLVAGYTGQTAPKVQAAVKSAFGGVLFIDEAYSLVQGEKDTFGREAVDTLIKEIEDHRDKVIVIFAGYHDEMDSFFQANPGFDSRVPFRFDFADYNCAQLAQIAQLQLKGQDVVLQDAAQPWMKAIVSAKTGCCTEKSLAEGTCAGSTRDNGNGRSVRNILESALRSLSVRAVASGEQSKEIVTQLGDIDVAAVGGELVAEELRTTCKEHGEALPNLEELATGARILSLPVAEFSDLLELSREDCSATAKQLQAATPRGKVISAQEVPLRGANIQKVFEELDSFIGLPSVKRAMRELYCTTQFAQMRKKEGLKPLKSQSYHMRFLGNPGTGKTVVARIVGKLLVELGVIAPPKGGASKKSGDEAIFTEVSRSELVAEYVGQTANKTQHAVSQSLGGVLFVDEAYSLVQSDRDTFGKEAVDTLIKEMEDKRENIVVICAGYHHEMETFFDSNPGFKSRVPFTFHFEDYTCPELSQMGQLMLKKFELVQPAELTSFNQAVRFTTACCDKLEECEESRDRGNGRAVRNAIEAGVRAMASRVSGQTKYPDRKMLSEMKSEDFAEVTKQMIESRLAPPCRANGEVAKLAAGKALPGNQEDLVHRLKRLSGDIALVEKMRGLDDYSKKLGGSCAHSLNLLFKSVLDSMNDACLSGGLLDVLLSNVEAAAGQEEIQELLRGMKAQTFAGQVLAALATDMLPEEQAAQESAQQACDAKLHSIKASRVVPFDYFTQM